jgi:hypothetical protein
LKAGRAVFRGKREQRRAEAEAKKITWKEKVRKATGGSEEEAMSAEETLAAQCRIVS